MTAGFIVAAPPPIRKGPIIHNAPGEAKPSAPKPAIKPKAPAPKPGAKPAPPSAKPVAKPLPPKPATKSAPPSAGKLSAVKPPPPPGKAKVVAPPVVKGAGLMPRAPYRGAVAVDADTGRVLFTDHAHEKGRPASVTKLMTFLLVLEDLQAGRYTVNHRATASAFASTMEPSKVDIRPGQSMTVGDLLYSIMVKSANDAAEVLAEHAAFVRSGGAPGTPPPPGVSPVALRDAFVARMNRRAQELGMTHTRYASPNGLPPSPATQARDWDVSTAADLVKLARAVIAVPGALRYTSCAGVTVTDGSGRRLALQNHNYFVPRNPDPKKLCAPMPGCDGLKTGFTQASGSSIVLTASERGRRVIVAVLGSAGRHEREAAAGRLLRDALDAVSIW